MYPFIHLFSFDIPAYGLCMTLALFVSCFFFLQKIKKAGYSWENALVIVSVAFGFAMAGAVLLYIAVTYTWDQIVDMLFHGVLFSGENIGFVFYGGLLASIPGAWIGAKIAQVSVSDYIPYAVPYIPLGHAIGRIGCFLGGCCYGVPTHLPIGVIYPHNPISSAPEGIPLFPVQLAESALLFSVFFILLRYTRKKRPWQCVAGLYFILYSVCRFLLENLRYDAIRGHWGLLSTSQWISLLLFAVGMLLFLPAGLKSEKKADQQARKSSSL